MEDVINTASIGFYTLYLLKIIFGYMYYYDYMLNNGNKNYIKKILRMRNFVLFALFCIPQLSADRPERVFLVSFLSSPEHNVLRGSYCDRSSSGVRPSVHLSVR